MPTQKFFISCGRGDRYFYAVEIHPTKRSMLRSISKYDLGLERHASDSRACCLRFQLNGPDVAKCPLEQIGTVFLHREDCGLEVVAHELTHAAIGWARRSKVQPVTRPRRVRYSEDPEERFARCLQHLVSQFYEHSNLPA
jgi:hypothetical protein